MKKTQPESLVFLLPVILFVGDDMNRCKTGTGLEPLLCNEKETCKGVKFVRETLMKTVLE